MAKNTGIKLIEGVFGKATNLIKDLELGAATNLKEMVKNDEKIAKLSAESSTLLSSSKKAEKLASKLQEFIN